MRLCLFKDFLYKVLGDQIISIYKGDILSLCFVYSSISGSAAALILLSYDLRPLIVRLDLLPAAIIYYDDLYLICLLPLTSTTDASKACKS